MLDFVYNHKTKTLYGQSTGDITSQGQLQGIAEEEETQIQEKN